MDPCQIPPIVQVEMFHTKKHLKRNLIKKILIFFSHYCDSNGKIFLLSQLNNSVGVKIFSRSNLPDKTPDNYTSS